MGSFLERVCDNAELQVSDSNERLSEYLLGALRHNDLESFVTVAPHRDGYRLYVGEDMFSPFAFVDVYLDGESLVVEDYRKSHLTDAEIHSLAHFLGIDDKLAGVKLNRFRRFVNMLLSMDGESVDKLRDVRISDSYADRVSTGRRVRRGVSDSEGSSWSTRYVSRLSAVPVPEGSGRMSEEDSFKYMSRRMAIGKSEVVRLLNMQGFDAELLDEQSLKVRGNGSEVVVTLFGFLNDNGSMWFNTSEGTQYFDVVDADKWLTVLSDALGGRVMDSDGSSDSIEIGTLVAVSEGESERRMSDLYGKEGFLVSAMPAIDLAAVDFGSGDVRKVPYSFLRVVKKVEDSSDSVSDLLESLRSDSSPQNLKRVARILKEQGRTSLRDGNREVMAVAEYPNGKLVYSYNQKAWQEVGDSAEPAEATAEVEGQVWTDDWKSGLREIKDLYESGELYGTELADELERMIQGEEGRITLTDDLVPEDLVQVIYRAIDEFYLARKHSERYGGRESDGTSEFHAWFDSFCSEQLSSEPDVAGDGVREVIDSSDAELLAIIREAEKDTKTDLTDAEKLSGDYPKGVFDFHGMSVAIENPKGSVRSGVDENGDAWSTEMKDVYGYLEGTAGADIDDIDVFVGEHPSSEDVFIVDQVKEDGSFDEHKVMLGYTSTEEAREAYLRNYDEGWSGLGDITHIKVDDLCRWIESDKTRDKAFVEYIRIQDSMTEGAVSTTQAGQEQYEEFKTRLGRKTVKRVQYDYRTPDGELFSCVGADLAACRAKRDAWLAARGAKVSDAVDTNWGKTNEDDKNYHVKNENDKDEIFDAAVLLLFVKGFKNEIYWRDVNAEYEYGDEYYGLINYICKCLGIKNDDNIDIVKQAYRGIDTLAGLFNYNFDRLQKYAENNKKINYSDFYKDMHYLYAKKAYDVLLNTFGDTSATELVSDSVDAGEGCLYCEVSVSHAKRFGEMLRDRRFAIQPEYSNTWYIRPGDDQGLDDLRDEIEANMEAYGIPVDEVEFREEVVDSCDSVDLSLLMHAGIHTDDAPSYIKLGSRVYRRTGVDEWTGEATATAEESKYSDTSMYDKVRAAHILEVPVVCHLSSVVKDEMDHNEDKEQNISIGWTLDELLEVLRAGGDGFKLKKRQLSKGKESVKDSGTDMWFIAIGYDSNGQFTVQPLGLRSVSSVEELSKAGELVDPYPFAVDKDSYDKLIAQAEGSYGYPVDRRLEQLGVSDDSSSPRRDFIFPAESSTVNDGKGHFPINTIARGRAALAMVARYDSLPEWYSGDMDLEKFKLHVRSEVSKAYPSIKVSE